MTHEAHPALRSLIQGACDSGEDHADEVSRLFKIRTADSHGQRSSASVLINRMYASRGYRVTPLPSRQLPTRITFTASEHDDIIGTITIGFDSDDGLHVDELFARETHAIRREGRRVCEFTKLAMDSVVQSKRVLASLFHVSYIFAHRMMGLDDLLIEVNPRHVRYYQRMLGFEVLCAPRHNPRVNAPAVLMRLRFTHAHEQIDRFGGRPEYSLVERSLYPLFFSVEEEASIVGRLKATQPDAMYASHGYHPGNYAGPSDDRARPAPHH
ncbi:MAG TPA: long-chain N-acyl amino acid synthase [Burkholderiaceae bacterium]|nr:long-chain N-acyl amino acid synthase [Burkholderiaceae bacterium]